MAYNLKPVMIFSLTWRNFLSLFFKTRGERPYYRLLMRTFYNSYMLSISGYPIISNAFQRRLKKSFLVTALCLFYLFVSVHPTFAKTQEESKRILIGDQFNSQSLTPTLYLLEDPDFALTLDDILVRDKQGYFSAAEKQDTNLGFTHSAWWIKFSLANLTNSPKRIIIRQSYPLIDEIDFWENTTAAGWQVHQTGDHRNFNARQVAFKDFLFPVDLAAGSEHTFYIRYKTKGSMDIALTAYEPIALLEDVSLEQLAYGVYYGGFLVLVIYNIFIFIAVRDKAFLYYLLYILSYGLYMSNSDGFYFQFITPKNPHLANHSLLVLLGLSLIFAIQFSRHILSIPNYSKTLDNIGKGFVGALGVITLCSFLLSYADIIVTLSIITFCTMTYISVIGVAQLTAGHQPARYFLLAWIALILGVMIYIVKIFGGLPNTFFTENAFQIGSLIEMMLLSLALGSRVHQLKQQSNTDALTEIANRRMFNELLETEFQRSLRNHQPLSLLMIDIDNFKRFNDEFGHSLGDEVLKNVAHQLQSIIRKPMLPCRYGGEEFAVILPRTNVKDASVLAERLRQHIEHKHIAQHKITVSIGVAGYDEWVFESTLDMLKAADTALYAAKDAGRNRVSIYTREMLNDHSTEQDLLTQE